MIKFDRSVHAIVLGCAGMSNGFGLDLNWEGGRRRDQL